MSDTFELEFIEENIYISNFPTFNTTDGTRKYQDSFACPVFSDTSTVQEIMQIRLNEVRKKLKWYHENKSQNYCAIVHRDSLRRIEYNAGVRIHGQPSKYWHCVRVVYVDKDVIDWTALKDRIY